MKRALLLAGMVTAMACSKTKTDIIPGNLLMYNNLSPSTVRLVLGFNYDLVVKGDTLTNWLQPKMGAIGNQPSIPVNPTVYFPATGKLNGEYYLPQELLDAKGQAIVKVFALQYGNTPPVLVDSFQVQENYTNPSDYYLTSTTIQSNGATGFTKIPRAVSPAGDPTHIRIRLINLGASSVSLAFADGSPVSSVTSGIANGLWSDYVELPYGACQFRVLADNSSGLQIPGTPPILMNAASMTDYTIGGGQYYTPVKTFQPGGVYSVVVASVGGKYQYNEYPLTPPVFSFVTDITPAVNLTYARVQAANAAEQGGLHVLVDGADSLVGYGLADDYQALIAGMHTVKVTDGSGKLLCEKNVQVMGGDNLTFWVYPASGGADSILVVENNMGGRRQGSVNGDGSDASNLVYDPLNFGMVVQTRFLNLCPDLPYVTFTRPNGVLIPEDRFSSAKSAQNLQPGRAADAIAISYPYVDLGYGSYAAVEVYGSGPGILPGNRLTGVPDLQPADFVHLPSGFYPNEAPGMEAGVYTVALIGRSNGSEQPKMIVVKHNR